MGNPLQVGGTNIENWAALGYSTTYDLTANTPLLMPWDTEIENVKGNPDLANDGIIANVAGRYMVAVRAAIQKTVAGSWRPYIYIYAKADGVEKWKSPGCRIETHQGPNENYQGHYIISVASGELVTIEIESTLNSVRVDGAGDTRFALYRIGPSA